MVTLITLEILSVVGAAGTCNCRSRLSSNVLDLRPLSETRDYSKLETSAACYQRCCQSFSGRFNGWMFDDGTPSAKWMTCSGVEDISISEGKDISMPKASPVIASKTDSCC